jgi:hypothetical protein
MQRLLVFQVKSIWHNVSIAPYKELKLELELRTTYVHAAHILHASAMAMIHISMVHATVIHVSVVHYRDSRV